MDGSFESLPCLSLPLAWELHGGQDHLCGAILSVVPGVHRVLSVSEPELLYSGSHVSADRPTVRLQPGSISQLLTVFSDLSHIIN